MFGRSHPTLTRTLRLLLIGSAFAATLTIAFALAQFVADDAGAQALVANFGYLGVVTLAIIAGLNAIIPVPAATFVPVFASAGLLMPLIIIALVIGTTIADLIGYIFGRWSRRYVADHYPRTFQAVSTLQKNRRHLLLPAVFCYAAFVPFPNEAIIIPLALVGTRFQTFMIPLVLGTLVNQAALAYGFSSAFDALMV